jgi:transaldolase
MNIPSKIKVGGINYQVKIVDELTDALADIDFGNQTMRVVKAKSDAMAQAFLHELFHAINGELSEETVEFLAVSFFQIIKDNPKLFETKETYGCDFISKTLKNMSGADQRVMDEQRT